ncbi:DNase I-like protein [Schizopora paradoxa]|uniref:DNA-(apurinic or apyrimidinic site) endonuclease n=1 Tax=Schizopora paradoxa TaxID=27342 RepID=A0A0H2R7U9_9AGAM|nr:DNase I-like protein [Schizopora paradoxa]
MRILTWNINGIRTLPQYHPWNQLKTCENILKELKADIICFQETKTSRAALERQVALPGDNFDAFFSFPSSKKGGYSGVAVFTNAESALPLKAEEGLSGLLNTPPSNSKSTNATSSDEPPRISPRSGYPRAGDEQLVLLPLSSDPDDPDGPAFVLSKATVQEEFALLDAEGRCLIMDFGLFVLFNLYCPNSDNGSSRHAYKMNFHNLLGERVRRLMEEEKREVIVVGDINICAAPIDHCEGNLPGNKESFYDPPAREWFKNWIDPESGPMVDVLRQCWPDRKGMYTCWNTKISARETNYGTRIDYILLSRGLLPWFKHGDIMPSVRGSDHCPVYIDLHDEIAGENGEVRKLRDEMQMSSERREPPRLCAKFWPEFSGKQQLLSSFFGKGKKDPRPMDVSFPLPDIGADVIICPTVEPISSSSSEPKEKTDSADSEVIDITGQDIPSDPKIQSQVTITSISSTSQRPSASPVTPGPSSTTNGKRKQSHPDSNYASIGSSSSKKSKTEEKETSKSKAKGKAPGQTKLSNFFSGSQSQPSGSSKKKANDPVRSSTTSTSSPVATQNPIDVDASVDLISDTSLLGEDDPEFLLSIASQVPSQASSSTATPPSTQSLTASQSSSNKNGVQHSWSTLFMRVEPPRCHVHNEPTRSFRVNKQGPNRGKEFYLCSRPVGPGYDAGRDKRRREDVDPQYRCSYFKWASEVRNDAIAKGTKSQS